MQQTDAKLLEDMSIDDAFKSLDANPDTGLSQADAEQRLARYGPNLLPEENSGLLKQMLGYFWGPIPWMIEAAAILSAIVGRWDDFALIMAMLLINAGIGFFQERSASSALGALKKQLALKARVLRDGQWREADAGTLVPGDILRLRLGDVVPADVKLFGEGFLSVDQAALTGESLPVSLEAGKPAYSGSMIKQGEMRAVAVATGQNTYLGRTAGLVQEAGAVSHFQKAVIQVGDFLILVAIFLAIVLFGVELYRGEPLLRLLAFILVLVVASIPVAMPAVLSVTLALGALVLSKMKAIVSHLQAIEELAGIDVLCSDKTGTLTQNRLTLGEPVLAKAKSPQDLILAAALASQPENGDAIDDAVIGGLKDRHQLDGFQQLSFTPFDPVSKRTEALVRSTQGQRVVTKGAPQVILGLTQLDKALRDRMESAVETLAAKGYRTLGVAERHGTEWEFLGILPLFDPPRESSAETIARAHQHGIRVKMVTGDNLAIARETSRVLGMGTNILAIDELADKSGGLSPEAVQRIEEADGFAQVFPEHKYAIIKALQDHGHLAGMTGDGVNDAPALKQADMGIAVSGATDAARAAADLILTAPGLSVIIRAVEEGRRIFERMMSYTIYRIAMTVDIMVFVVLAMLALGSYPLTPVMIIVLALLDDIPIMAIAFDNTLLDPKPVRWDMRRVLIIASVLGLASVVQSFILLYLGRYSFHFGTGMLQTAVFLQLVVGGHLMLFLTRQRGFFWQRPTPSAKLFLAIAGTQVLAATMAGLGWLVPALPWAFVGLVWLYNLAWMFILDFIKLGGYALISRRDPDRHHFTKRTEQRLHHGA